MSAPARSSHTIFLLVSDPLVRTVFQETLENAGYLVVPAGNLGSAVDRLKTIKPDLLIIRSYVSDVPGHSAATYLRKRCPGLPVLMVGGQMEDDRLSNRAALDSFHTFPKPFSSEELLKEIDGILLRKVRSLNEVG